jgi:transcriptional regulator with XRE-family HTH domain
MTWDLAAADAVRSVRTARGLTQHALAEVSGIPQPTISEIESGKRQPGLPLLARILESAQGPTELRLVAQARHSAVGTAGRIATALAPGGSGEDSALRAVLDLRDTLLKADAERLGALTREAPRLSGDRRFDAFVAGVVEEAYAKRHRDPPGWTQERSRFVRPFWYVSDLPELHWWEFSTAPGSLLRHGVLAAEAELASV